MIRYSDQVTDIQEVMFKMMMAKSDAEKAELKKKLFEDVLPKNFKFFEDKLKQTKSGYLVGSGLTLADIYLISVLEKLGDGKEGILANYSELYKLDKRVRSHPKIADWIAKRPVTPF